MTGTSAEVLAAVWDAANPIMQAAREQHGPIPSLRSEAFVHAPRIVRQAGLIVCGQAWIVGEGALEKLLMRDYLDGRYHRRHMLPALTQLDRRQWPPTGDRDLWVRYGPDGPPPALELTA